MEDGAAAIRPGPNALIQPYERAEIFSKGGQKKISLIVKLKNVV